jgi:uncharacterized protein (DUF1778 family)
MPPIATTTERLSTPLSSQRHKILQQAADLVGTTLNQFVIQASLEKAQTIIEQEQILRLSQQDAEDLKFVVVALAT